ncbi:MAG: hypothetical protein NC485_14615 [Ruminococcus flavefaciens]|nr:hypothetical protein [Ruminococcus flavefaciens]
MTRIRCGKNIILGVYLVLIVFLIVANLFMAVPFFSVSAEELKKQNTYTVNTNSYVLEDNTGYLHCGNWQH